jgi:hypothetical protein
VNGSRAMITVATSCPFENDVPMSRVSSPPT